jgi:hypothetical protein
VEFSRVLFLSLGLEQVTFEYERLEYELRDE